MFTASFLFASLVWGSIGVERTKLVQPARVTMFFNSVLVHLNQEIYGETGHRILPEYKQKTITGPLALAHHNCPVRFRNIWLRPL